MADTVQISAGTGTTIATDDRGAVGHVQRVVDQGGSVIATGQVAPTTTAATLLAANTTRKVVTFVNHGTVDVYIGPATVTTSNGLKLAAGAAIDIETTALIQAITASGTGSVHYIEVSD